MRRDNCTCPCGRHRDPNVDLPPSPAPLPCAPSSAPCPPTRPAPRPLLCHGQRPCSCVRAPCQQSHRAGASCPACLSECLCASSVSCRWIERVSFPHTVMFPHGNEPRLRPHSPAARRVGVSGLGLTDTPVSPSLLLSETWVRLWTLGRLVLNSVRNCQAVPEGGLSCGPTASGVETSPAPWPSQHWGSSVSLSRCATCVEPCVVLAQFALPRGQVRPSPFPRCLGLTAALPFLCSQCLFFFFPERTGCRPHHAATGRGESGLPSPSPSVGRGSPFHPPVRWFLWVFFRCPSSDRRCSLLLLLC